MHLKKTTSLTVNFYCNNYHKPKDKLNDLDETAEVRRQNHEMWSDRKPTIDVEMFNIDRHIGM